MIFPEGTRYDVRGQGSLKRAKSQEFARSVGLPELEHVLTPRTTGFEVSRSNTVCAGYNKITPFNSVFLMLWFLSTCAYLDTSEKVCA